MYAKDQDKVKAGQTTGRTIQFQRQLRKLGIEDLSKLSGIAKLRIKEAEEGKADLTIG